MALTERQIENMYERAITTRKLYAAYSLASPGRPIALIHADTRMQAELYWEHLAGSWTDNKITKDPEVVEKAIEQYRLGNIQLIDRFL